MKQKVNIARSLIHTPPVNILDEPTAGLDVLTSRSIVEFIRASRREGKVVILSTHILSEVKAICRKVLLIHRGKIVADDTVANLTKGKETGLEDKFIQLTAE
jgi:sodium transport system ATP-binding protein